MSVVISSSIYLLPFYVFYAHSLTLPNLPTLNAWSINSSDLDLNNPFGGYNNSNVPDISLLSPRYPRDFNVSIAIAGPRLNITSMLYTTVDAMKQLALQDFFEVLHSPEIFVLDGHSDFGIAITPLENPVRGLERRFAIWGIYQCAVEMYNEKKFQQAEVTLLWKDTAVGTVDFLPDLVPPSLSLPVGSEGGNNASTLLSRAAAAGDGIRKPTVIPSPSPNLPTNISQALQTLPVSVPGGIQISYQPHALRGAKIPIFNVFLSVMPTLASLANSPKDKRAREYEYVINELHTAIGIRAALYLEYSWVIEAVAGLLPYMIGAGQFWAVRMDLTLDGKEVGIGVFGDEGVFG